MSIRRTGIYFTVKTTRTCAKIYGIMKMLISYILQGAELSGGEDEPKTPKDDPHRMLDINLDE